MKQISSKDVNTIARMAGNIAGPLLANLVDNKHEIKGSKSDLFDIVGEASVAQALAIVEVINSRRPCNKCGPCNKPSMGKPCDVVAKEETNSGY